MVSGIGIHPVSGALGAEVSGVDLVEDLGGGRGGVLRRGWLGRMVVVFRDQPLTPPQLLGFARRFGDTIEYPFVQGLEEYPDIIPVVKLEHERINFGGVWHSAAAYLDGPPLASMLLAREVPPAGGDTLFASMYLAYETLSDGMKRLLAGLRAVNSSAKADASRTREDRIAERGRADARTLYEAAHPVVRVHPETGRKALYVNVAHTIRFEGMTEEESAPLLGYLYRHQIRPEFTCRFRWRPGSLAFWDNRCAQHNAVNDYAGHRRVMHRITLAGDVPAGPT